MCVGAFIVTVILVRVLACCHSTHWFLTAVISVVRLMFATFILAVINVVRLMFATFILAVIRVVLLMFATFILAVISVVRLMFATFILAVISVVRLMFATFILAVISVVRLMFATFILALILVHYTDEELTNVCKHYHFTARHTVPEVASFVSGFSFTPRKIMVTVRRTLEPFQGRRWGNF